LWTRAATGLFGGPRFVVYITAVLLIIYILPTTSYKAAGVRYWK